MATVITSECINCAACEPECPNTAIYQGGVQWELGGQLHPPLAGDLFYIVPEKCTECVGFYDYEACAAVCPVDCCVPNPDVPETEEALIARAKQLHPELEFPAQFASRFKPPAAAGNRPAPKAVRAVAPPAARDVVSTAPAAPAAAPAATPAAVPTPAAPAPASAAAKPVVAAPPTAPPVVPAVKPVASPTPVVAAAVMPAAAVSKTAAGPAMMEKPVAAPKAAGRPQSAPRTEKAFPGELSISFPDALALLQRRDEQARYRPRWLAAALRRRRRAEARGSVGLDGFTDARFEDKLERERRYGKVYRLRERPNGFLLEMSFPRRIPRSAIKEELGVPDEMPDYACGLALLNGFLTVTGKVVDPAVRRVAAVSPAFPPDFETHIKLPSPVQGFRHRFRGKDLEVALIKHV